MLNNDSYIRRNLVKVIYLFFLISSFCFAQEFTLEQAIDYALKSNYKIKQFEEKVKQKEYQEYEAYGNFLPVISFNGTYTHLNDPIIFDLEPVRQAMITLQANNQVEFANVYNIIKTGIPLSDDARNQYFNGSFQQLNSKIPLFRETLKKQDYLTANITAVQPLFMGGKLFAAKSFASNEIETANVELIQIKNEIKSEVINSYLNVALLKEIISVRLNVIAGVRKHKVKAERLLEEGLISNFNVLRARVAESEAEKNYSTDLNKYNSALLALKTIMNYNFFDSLLISDSLFFSDFNNNYDNVLNEGLLNQPLLKIIELKKESLNEKYKVDFSSLLPTIAAFGKYELYPEYLSTLEPRWAVGIQASLNIFNGGRDYSKLQATSHLQDELEYLEKETQSKLRLLITKNYNDIAESKYRYEKSNSTIILARENLRLNEKRFDSGLGTSLEIIDAHLSLEKAEIDSKASLYDYYKSLNELYKSTGNMNEFVKIWNLRGNK